MKNGSMVTRTDAAIYLSEQRGCTQLESSKSLHTFNFRNYFDESKKAFGTLQVINDDTLRPGAGMKMQVKYNAEVIIIPVIGGLEYKNDLVLEGFVEAGEILVFSAVKGMEYEIINPYENELINFIQIWLRNDQPVFVPDMQSIRIDLSRKNNLLPVFSGTGNGISIQQDTSGWIGKYIGREEGQYVVRNPENGIFIFVISGVFEVEDRLLHAKDGLALKNTDAVEFEALSNDAIIMVMEIGNSGFSND
ncbi:pirin family protein [Pseudarcicella hirudinis]|nr:pirin family protein [Pseudarcicella hirudinis]